MHLDDDLPVRALTNQLRKSLRGKMVRIGGRERMRHPQRRLRLRHARAAEDTKQRQTSENRSPEHGFPPEFGVADRFVESFHARLPWSTVCQSASAPQRRRR
jgi:hypothetical protein